jgi:2-methylcitrate dehydratase
MQDHFQELFAAYATKKHSLPADTIHEVKRRIIDSFGVMYAASQDDSPRVARAYAEAFPTERGARIFGSTLRAAPDVAGFANGVHVRYLDFNDTYLSLEPLHPSDVIPPLLALAETRHLPGSALIAAIAIAYEIGVNLCDAASLRAHKWDHVNYIAIMVAAGAAHLLNLNHDQAGHALSLATVPHASMRQTRAGELSMWKGAAAANSSRNALVAALLAEKGMTGPFQPFEGEMGFCKLLTHATFDLGKLDSLVNQRPPHRILDTYIKKYPVEYHAQSAVDAALDLDREMHGAQLLSVHIDTFKASYEIIARDPEKWQPKTRETADHSIQYITVVALEDGTITQKSFALARIRSSHTQEFLAQHTTLAEKPELTAGYPDGIPNTITVKLSDGRTLSETIRYPRGHARNPMTDDEVIAKFNTNVTGRLAPDKARALCDAVWSLDECADVSAFTEKLTIFQEEQK